MVYEWKFPALLMPWIIYQGDGVKTRPISKAKIHYEDDGRGMRLTIEYLVSNLDFSLTSGLIIGTSLIMKPMIL